MRGNHLDQSVEYMADQEEFTTRVGHSFCPVVIDHSFCPVVIELPVAWLTSVEEICSVSITSVRILHFAILKRILELDDAVNE